MSICVGPQVPQAEMLQKITKLDAVINLELRQDILVLKAISRRTCRNCGEGYNLANIQNGDMVMPPLLPKKEGICDKVRKTHVQTCSQMPTSVHRFV
jgi:hypothetical protein